VRHGGRRRPAWPASLIDDIARLGLLLPRGRVEGNARPVASGCSRLPRGGTRPEDGEAPSGALVAVTAPGAARPLAEAISRRLRAIRDALAGTAAEQEAHAAAPAMRRLLVPDAFSNPEYVRFALKVTLAVMICYFVQNLADWSGTHTCVITCYFVALGTVGETLHKATADRRLPDRRSLGLGAILALMPHMIDLGDPFLLSCR
jgi:multidrug resistance protein MdtO